MIRNLRDERFSWIFTCVWKWVDDDWHENGATRNWKPITLPDEAFKSGERIDFPGPHYSILDVIQKIAQHLLAPLYIPLHPAPPLTPLYPHCDFSALSWLETLLKSAAGCGRQIVAPLTYTAVLRKNAVWTFESCHISFDKMFMFEETYEYSPLKFSGLFGGIASKIIWKIGRKIFISWPGDSCFIKGNLATPEGSYGVLP